MMPVRCYTCNSPIDYMYDEYIALLKDRRFNAKKALNDLNLYNDCCRGFFITNGVVGFEDTTNLPSSHDGPPLAQYVDLENKFSKLVQRPITYNETQKATCNNEMHSGLNREPNEGPSKKKTPAIKHTNDVQCSAFKGLRYEDNSCATDSAIVALFGIPNKFITKNVLENTSRDHISGIEALRHELKRITSEMRKGEYRSTISKLREKLRDIENIKRHKMRELQTIINGGQVDAPDVIASLFGLLDINTGLTWVETVTHAGSTPRTRTLVQSPIWDIGNASNLLGANSKLSEHLVKVDTVDVDVNGVQQQNKITTEMKIEDAEYLIVTINRLCTNANRLTGGASERFLELRAVIPDETIHINNRRKLHLNAIIVYKSRHWTCYVRCDGSWWWYDDTRPGLTNVGTYEEMLQCKEYDPKEGSAFVYVQED